MAEFNEKIQRKQLIDLYTKFLDNPESEMVKSELIEFDKNFGGIIALNDYLKAKPIPVYISEAIGHISILFQYGDNEFYSNPEIIDMAKRILQNLKK